MKSKGKKVKTIDLIPTWPEAARILIAVLENGDREGKQYARAELVRMAEIAQMHVDSENKKKAGKK